MNFDDTAKRITICVFYDRKGKVSDVFTYLLRGILRVSQRLIVVVNGRISVAGMQRLSELTDEIIVRDNVGYDFGAWKEVIVNYLGVKALESYDELVLMNDSVFGPLYPFETVFQNMKYKDVDFWGLTEHAALDFDYLEHFQGAKNPYGYTPKHIQSYFVVIRKRMLSGKDFIEYWKHVPTFRTLQEAVGKGETVFTKYFEDKGYKCAAYIDTTKLDANSKKNPQILYCTDLFYLVKNGLPLIKRKLIGCDFGKVQYDKSNNGEDLHLALDYISKKYTYDMNMVWKDALERYNQFEIRSNTKKNYVIDDKIKYKKSANRILLLLYVHQKEGFFRLKHYIDNVQGEIDIAIINGDENWNIDINSPLNIEASYVINCLSSKNYLQVMLDNGDIIKKYDYFCFCHDCIIGEDPFSYEEYTERQLWENALKSKNHIYGIVNKFEEEGLLGVVSTPAAIRDKVKLQRKWLGNYENYRKLFCVFGISLPVGRNMEPVDTGSMFWARTTAILPLLNANSDALDIDINCCNDFIERFVSYLAQDRGYYTARCFSMEYAEVWISQLGKLWYQNEDSVTNMANAGIKSNFLSFMLSIELYLKKRFA